MSDGKDGITWNGITCDEFAEAMYKVDNVITALEERIEDVEYHIEAMTKDNQYLDSINLHKRIIELERYAEINHLKYMKKVYPHKCPICEGKPLAELRIVPTTDGKDKLLIDCRACEGKGIVWG